MSLVTSLKPIRTALLGGALVLGLAAPALAQDEATESVIVTAPSYHRDGGRLNGDPGVLKLSREVSYADLDLGTRDGVRELRHRIRATAREVCEQLDEDSAAPGGAVSPCIRQASRDAMVRADAAIRDARSGDYYEAGYRGGE